MQAIPKPGDRAPLFTAVTDTTATFNFGATGGAWQVLVFFGSLADPDGAAAVETLRAREPGRGRGAHSPAQIPPRLTPLHAADALTFDPLPTLTLHRGQMAANSWSAPCA